MNDAPTILRLHGVVDHARAEAFAARIRAAVRNGRTAITISCEPGAVVASPNLLAFMLRAADHLRRHGGRLELTGDAAVLDQLGGLGILGRINTPAGVTP